jgi:hypothetical protein
LARKLLIALWRLVAHGEIAPGAVLADWYRKGTGRCATRSSGHSRSDGIRWYGTTEAARTRSETALVMGRELRQKADHNVLE